MRCAIGQLVEASGLGDVGFLTNVLLVHLLKKNLISEEKLALSGWKNFTYNRVKEVYDQGWNKVMEAVIQNEANPLYILRSGQLSRHCERKSDCTGRPRRRDSVRWDGISGGTGGAQWDDAKFDYAEQQHWNDLHICRVNHHAHPVHEVRRLAFNDTPYDHDMDNYNREMTQIEWDFLAPRETNWRENWCAVSLELRD